MELLSVAACNWESQMCLLHRVLGCSQIRCYSSVEMNRTVKIFENVNCHNVVLYIQYVMLGKLVLSQYVTQIYLAACL